MFLTEFNSTQLQKTPGVVFGAAQDEPVLVNRMGHKAVVMMSKEKYAELVKAANAKK